MLEMFIVGEDTDIRRLDTRCRIQRGTSRRGGGVAGFSLFVFLRIQ